MPEKANKPANEDAVLYEVGFHLVPTIAEDTLGKECETIESLISKSGGEIVSKSAPALVKLAYTLIKKIDSKNYKYDTAYFGWMKFTATGADAQEIQTELDGLQSIIRYIVLKTETGADIEAADVATALNGKAKESASDDDSEAENKNSDEDSDENESREDSDDSENDSDGSDSDDAETSKESDDSMDEVDKAIDDIVGDKA